MTFGSSNKKNEAFTHITKNIKKTPIKQANRLTIKTIHYYARLYNKNKYEIRFCKNTTEIFIEDFIYDILGSKTDYDFAIYFCKKWGEIFKCIDVNNKIFYKFNINQLWEKFENTSCIREIISNEMFGDFVKYQEHFQTELTNYNDATEEYEKINRTIKNIAEICIKLKKTNDKNNITREITDKIFDSQFEKILNKKKGFLPIQNNKIINVETLEILDRTMEHAFTFECPVDYVNMSIDEENYVKQYFLDLFCGNEGTMQCVIDILKSIFCGKKLRYFFFFVGKGCNGKSLLFKILNEIFSKTMDTIDTKIILETKQSSGLSTEFQKLDKIYLGYITELTESDKLNTKIIKKISGGDPVDYRGLYKDNVTIIPTCNLCALTNELPYFKVEKGITDRLVTIPFNNTFKINDTFETELLERKSHIFSYILKHGNISDKFNFTEEMLSVKANYTADNEKVNHLEDFVNKFYEIVPFVKKEKVERDILRLQYNNFLKERGEQIDKSTHKRFANMMKDLQVNIKESNGKTYYIGLIEKFDLDEEDEK